MLVCQRALLTCARPWSLVRTTRGSISRRKLVNSSRPRILSPWLQSTRWASQTATSTEKFVSTGIDCLSKDVKEGRVREPFTYLNSLSSTSKIIRDFKAKVLDSRADDADMENGTQVMDFLNPKFENIGKLVQLISKAKYPKHLLAKFELNGNDDLLVFVLTRLLYRDVMDKESLVAPPKDSFVDMTNPAEWYPEARKMKRKIIMHVGPTNSGKTYTSLQKLKTANLGYYAGPLRLLAREIFEKFNKEGHPCNLLTGEDVVPVLDEFGKLSGISSGTIEMIPLDRKMDVCIIDEIQMIADTKRGGAWTSAVLGVLAKEVHLCGEASAVPWVKKMVEVTGDELVINEYDRLGKLTVMDQHLGTYTKLRKGDCVIVFSKRKIVELKCKIERETRLKVGIIYGALPPEIRSAEAERFNSGKSDVLVASDAIGMGLNLRIKRIVFEKAKKFDGNAMVPLQPSAVKQIAGRAGRFSLDRGELEGFVTALQRNDLKYVKQQMKSPIVEIEKACIWPTNEVWMQYLAESNKNMPLKEIFSSLNMKASDNKQYFLSDMEDRLLVLQMLSASRLDLRIPIEEQLKLVLAPVGLQVASPTVLKTVLKYFSNIADRLTGTVFDFGFLQKQLLAAEPKEYATTEDIMQTLVMLEDSHKLVMLFMWLLQRWPTLFIDRESAVDIKSLIEKRIGQELENLRRLNKK